jgi:hypothetical protein
MTLPLSDALSQCARHAAVLQLAMTRIPQPVTAALVHEADEDLVRSTDQFALRFIKLQDTLGEHVLRPFAADVLGEPVSDLSLIDVLNRLERFGYLSASQWLRWRALRDALTHEDPEQPQIRSAVLNESIGAALGMVALLDRLGKATNGIGSGKGPSL